MNIKKLLFTVFLFSVSIAQLFASHGMGGEITWTCSGNAYVFKLKFYRDCNGIPGPSSVILETNQPNYSGTGINMPLLSQIDISPTGSNTSGVTNCPTCATGGNGAVEEFVFQSAPVTLSGNPPAAGWAFWYDDCCRSGALTNIPGGGSYGYTLRAKMYTHPSSIAGVCMDASPYFAEKPSTIICTGYPFTYNHNAVDPELDSLVYSWDAALDWGGYPQASCPYSAGYSATSPLPGPAQNPNNVAATINPNNGEVHYTSFTQGYFATVIKVTAYKCGVKDAEVWREINVVLVTGCTIPGVPPPNNTNHPPIITPPFPDPISGAPQSSYQTTVFAGDTINFTLPAIDNDPHPVLGVQTITFTASGNEFGAGYTNPNAGCIIAPCATLSPAPPVVAVFGTQVGFNWRTSCAHVKGLNLNCVRIAGKFNFVIKVQDNFCPANGISVATIEVTIQRPPKLLPPTIKCVSVANKFGDLDLTWTPPAPRDTHATFAQYEIWASLTGAMGSYVKLDSVYGGLNRYLQTSLSIPAAKQQAVLGTNVQNSSIYFQMFTRCGCDSDSLSIASNTARSIKPNAVPGPTGSVDVSWNAVHSPLLATSGLKYYIWKEFPIGTWALLDSTTHPTLSYRDTTTRTICNDSITYRILTKDYTPGAGCDSWSAFAGIHVINAAPVATITPLNPSFCAGLNVNLTANAGGSTYSWSSGQTTQAITVSTAGTYTVTITYQPGGCTSTTSTNVTVNTVPTASVAGTASICAGSNTNITFSFTGTGPWTYSYNTPFGPSALLNTAVSPVNIAVSPASTFNYTLIGVNNVSCPGTVSGNANITVNTIPSATITGTAAICSGSNTNLTITFANGPAPYTVNYTINGVAAAPIVTNANPYVFNVSPAVTSNYVITSISNGNCPGTITGTPATVTVNALPTASVTGTAAICTGGNTNISIAFTGGAPYTYSYTANGVSSGPLVANSSPAVINVTPGVTTNYVLTSVSNANCPGTIIGVPAVVTVNTRPTATISGNPSICNGQQTSFTVNFAGAPGPYTYTYNPGNVVVNNANNPSIINVTPSSTTNYTLVSVSNVNCPGSVLGSATVTVHPLPTAQITGTQAICAGQPANLNVNFTGTGPWTYSYLANGNPVGPFNTNVSPAVITVNPAATSTYTLPLSVTDAYCTGTVTSGSATVTVKPLPTAQISGNATICAGTATNLTINFTGVAPFVYSYTDGTTVFGPFNTNNNNVNIPVTPNPTTVYTMTPTLTGAGCIGNTAGSATITVNQLPTASITGTATICNGSATNLSVAFAGASGPYTYSYTANGTPFGPFITNSNPAIIPVSPSANTTYIISSISNSNCPGTVTGNSAVVTVTPIPTATITGTTAICNGQSTNLTVTFTGQAPYTYSYKQGATIFGPFTTSTNPVIISVTPGSTSTYTLTGTVTGNGCTGTTSGSALITVNPLPTATISGAPTICSGDQTTLSIAFTGTAPYTYRYSDGTTTFGPFSTSDNPEIITVNPATTRTFTVTSITDNNCTGTTAGSSLVTVNPLPTAQISGTTAICNGDATNLTINFTGTAPFTYEYSNGTSTFGPFNTNNLSVSIPVSPANSTTYSVTAVSDNNCTGTFSGAAIVTVNQLPTATLTGNPVICNGQSTSISVSFTGTAPFVYSYSNGTNTFGPFTTSLNPTTIAVSPTSNTTYNLTATVTGAGCTGTTSGTASVVVHPLPTATASGLPVICNGESTSFNIAFTGAPPFTYSYSNGTNTFGPFNTNNNAVSIAVSPTATTTYTVNSIVDNNCTGSYTGSALVTVHPLPTAAITGTTAICRNNSTNLSIAFTGSAPYTYTYSDGTTTFGPFTTSNNPQTIQVQPLLNTTYSVTAVSDANCTGNILGSAAIITVHNLPEASISNNSTICIGAPANMNVSFVGTVPFTYSYSNGAQTFGPFTTSNNPQVITVTPATGIHTYTLTSINDAYCPGNITGTAASVIVNPLPTPVISGNNIVCDGDFATFDAGNGYISYLWSTGAITQTITNGTAGVYTVTVTDMNTCVNSTSQTLIVNQTPVVAFSNDSSLTCDVPKINFFNGSSFPPNSNFAWDFGDGSTSDLENPSHIFTTPGSYPISLIITTQAGCSDTLKQDINITFYPLPVAQFRLDPKAASVFNSQVNFVDQSQNAITWAWDFGDGSKTTVQNPQHYYDEIGQFKVKLIITSIAGCVSEFSDNVLITPFYVPNAFSPNGDGMNDEFFNAGYVMNVAAYNMSIFNRWGEKVFTNDNYHAFWKGLDKNGKAMPEGVYVYAIKVSTLTGKQYEYTGSVTLVR